MPNTTIKVLQSMLKNNQASAGIAPVISNITANQGTVIRCVVPFKITQLPYNRVAATWFVAESSGQNTAGVSQTCAFEQGASEFTLPRTGSVKINGATPTTETKFQLNKWYVAEIYGALSAPLEAIVLGAPSNNNNQVSAYFGEGMTFYLEGATDEVVNAKVAELKLKYGIAN